ncbi:protein CFAP20DC-like [Ptychodera flava]|uniref:protein CFAP20DC-like n=1 Tax=Ptychodera flava TaxID=63121 RepID=UPI003969EBC9
MFLNDFQGGAYFDVFGVQGKDPVSKWKVAGSAVRKVYDKDVKSYVVVIEGGTATTRIQLPKDNKQSLLLIQRYLVLQLMVPLGLDFSIELSISDMGNNKRRLFLSSAQKEISITPLHAKIPLSIMKRGVWLNMCLDLLSLVGDVFKGQTLKSLDTLTIAANCRLRRVFTMKAQPPDSTDDDELYDCQTSTNASELDSIPKTCQFGPDVHHFTQVLTMYKIRQAELKLKGEVVGTRPVSTTDPDLGASQKLKNTDVPMHIAFGSKVPVPTTSSKKPSSGGAEASGSRTSRSTQSKRPDELLQSMSGSSKHVQIYVHTNSDETNHEATEQSELLSARGVNIENPALTPHPPREKSSERTRRVVRVRSKKDIDKVTGENAMETSDDTDTTRNRTGSGEAANRHSSNRVGSGEAANRHSSNRIGSGEAANRHSSNRIGSGEAANRHSSNRIGSGEATNRHSSNREGSGEATNRHASNRSGSGEASSRHSSHRTTSEDVKNRHSLKQHREDIRQNKVTVEDASISHRKGSGELRKRHNHVHVERQVDRNGLKGDRGSKRSDEDTAYENGNTDTTDGDSSLEERSHHIVVENGQDSDEKCDKIYTFMSKPRSAPTRKEKSHSGVNHKTIWTNMKNEVASLRESQQALLVARGARPEEDFIGNEDDDEQDVKEKVRRQTPSPKSQQRTPSPDAHRLQIPGRNSLAVPDGIQSTPGNSQSRLSISSKKVREIPKDDARLSSVSPTRASNEYDWRKYASPNDSLSSSFEANMLASLQRQQLEEQFEDEDDDAAKPSSDLHHHNYGDDDLSSSSDDTSFSTWRGPAPAMLAHHYQDEMHLPSSSQSEFLNQSNPREWTSVFSPPIVLPSEQMKSEHLHPNSVTLPTKSPLKDDSRKDDSGKGESDGEDELELLYDPCLNCYFDPKTCKYYELV